MSVSDLIFGLLVVVPVAVGITVLGVGITLTPVLVVYCYVAARS